MCILSERQGVNLGLELTAHGEIGRLCEKVVPIRVVVLRRAGVRRVERGYTEDLPRSFTVAGGNYGRMNIVKTPVLEELVNREAQPVSHPCCSPYRVCPGPEVGNLAEVLEGVPLFLERIARRVGPAVQVDSFGLEFDALPFPRRGRHDSFRQDGAPGRDRLKGFAVRRGVQFCHHLEAF